MKQVLSDVLGGLFAVIWPLALVWSAVIATDSFLHATAFAAVGWGVLALADGVVLLGFLWVIGSSLRTRRP